MDHYVEPLPDEIAKMILGVSYVANCNYQIVHERQGSYVVAYNKETGERVDLEDGDDYSLDIDEFNLIEDEQDRLEDMTSTDFTKTGFGFAMWAAVAASVVFFITVLLTIYVMFFR